jgi:two-component system sensor histidine kinase MprB
LIRVARRVTHTSLRTRVSLAVAAAAAIVILAVALTSWLLTHRQLQNGVDEELVDAISTVARDGPRSPLGRRDDPRDHHEDEIPEGFGEPNSDEVAVAILDSDGVMVYASNDLAELVAAGADPRIVSETQGDSERNRLIELRTMDAADLNLDTDRFRTLRIATTTIDRLGQGYSIIAAKSLDPVTDTERTLAAVLGLSAVGGLAVALGLGWLVGASTVVPILRLGGAAAHVAETSDLDVRVPASSTREVNSVVESFNSMLASLRESRSQQARLVADAGHELRTPLTSLRTNVEVLASGGVLDAQDRADLVADVNEQIAELSALVADLTDLAASDSAAAAEFTDVRLDTVVLEAVRRAERRNLAVTFRSQVGPAWVNGNAHLLERAVLNLCDNAAKWSPAGGTVDVVMREVPAGSDRGGVVTDPTGGVAGSGHMIEVSVTDQGKGISDDIAEKVFERFWRAPEARSDPGSGLGLSIVAQVVASHGGTVRVDTAHRNGARVVLRLPMVNVGT